MQKILIISTILASTHASATQVYMKGSDCDIDKAGKVVEFYAQDVDYINGSTKAIIQRRVSERSEEILTQVKQHLSHNLHQRAQQYPNGLLITQAMIKNTYQSTERELLITGRIKAAKITGDCRKHQVIAADEPQLIASTYVAGRAHKYTLNLDLEVTGVEQNQAPETQVTQPVVTAESIFGIALRERYEVAEQKVGRFTLTWPVNASQTLAFVGRDHALLFEGGRLKGYQYGFNLLPLGLANFVDIYQVGLMLEVTGKAQLIEQTELSQPLVEQIEAQATKAVFFQQGKYTEHPKTILSELHIGDMSLSQPSALPCYDGQSAIKTFVTQHRSQLLQWQNLEKKTTLYTGCNQLIELTTLGSVASLKLLEPWSLRDASLVGIERLVANFKPWRLHNVHYKDPNSRLQQFGKVEDLYGTLAVSNEQWVGHFESYEGKLVAADLEKL